MLGAVAFTVVILGTGALVLGKLGSRFIDWVDSRKGAMEDGERKSNSNQQ